MKCHICKSDYLKNVLNLGNHPLCDDLSNLEYESLNAREYPINILYCNNCFTAFQEHNVFKEILFPPDYHYRARFTKDVLDGMNDLVSKTNKLLTITNKTVLDVGCNDGSLLDIFSKYGYKTIGVEPTKAIEDAKSNKHNLLNRYFDRECTDLILRLYGQPDVICFTNVFAHIENITELLANLKLLFKENTILIIENHYLGAILKNFQFDTFYHEHPRTYSLNSFLQISEILGLKLFKFEFPNRYGGNIRVFMGKDNTIEYDHENLKLILNDEKNFNFLFKKMNEKLINWRKFTHQKIENLITLNGGPLIAKAFPARAAIIIKILNLNEKHIKYICEKPGSLKIGNYVPGTKIEIKSDDILSNEKPIFIINFAWHIAKEIREYLSEIIPNTIVIDIIE